MGSELPILGLCGGNLGAFSISLAVKDIHASRAFYEKLGFTAMGGNIDQNWLILSSGPTVIGLFQGMFEKNMLTFNPGWGQDAKPYEPFVDVREIRCQLEAAGLTPASGNTADTPQGPAHFVLVDPDGNPILVDQHR